MLHVDLSIQQPVTYQNLPVFLRSIETCYWFVESIQIIGQTKPR